MFLENLYLSITYLKTKRYPNVAPKLAPRRPLCVLLPAGITMSDILSSVT